MKKYLLTFLITASLTLAYATISAGTTIQSAADVPGLFPKSVEEIEQITLTAKNNSTTQVEQIISIAPEDRTFENTVLACDKAFSDLMIQKQSLHITTMVHPDKTIRDKSQEATTSLKHFLIHLFNTNREIYRAFKEYVANQGKKDNLNEERQYYLSNEMRGFRNAGFELDDASFETLKQLQKEITFLSDQFNNNIAQDSSTLRVKKDDLLGVNDDFINTLPRDGNEYILRCDYPTRSQIMSNCSVESTRRNYSNTFSNRAYPQNLSILNQLINCRDQLANLLGYSSYAHYDIESAMAETPERVEAFLNELAPDAAAKAVDEWNILKQDLPDSVTLTPEGKIKPWDAVYLSQYYLKKHLNIDSDKIAEYFPMEQTTQGLLSIYSQFFGLSFQVVPSGPYWDPTVQTIEVRHNTGGQSLIGYVLVDLFPRPNKYSHPRCETVVLPMSFDGGNTYQPAVAVVIANFSKPTATKPSLLKHYEVKDFFHEFGHAIHILLGHAEMPTSAGLNCKMDFLEAPSQLLENWLLDRDILKMLSQHYQTGAPLPDEMIDALIANKDFRNGSFTSGEVADSMLSLYLFKDGQNKDPLQIDKALYNSMPRMLAYNPDFHGVCSFGHLTYYGSKYYSYLWSKKLALQIFDYIKTHGGLLDPAMGQRYVSKVIGKGGSRDPNLLMRDFLQD